jgi:hypothetical protein
MPTQLLNQKYALTLAQRQRLERAAASVPPPRRAQFRQRALQALWRMPRRGGPAADYLLGVAISCAQRELTKSS